MTPSHSRLQIYLHSSSYSSFSFKPCIPTISRSEGLHALHIDRESNMMSPPCNRQLLLEKCLFEVYCSVRISTRGIFFEFSMS